MMRLSSSRTLAVRHNPLFAFFPAIYFLLFLPFQLSAEGSKDFVGYPGYRMFLDTRDAQQLKVYANAGETINVGASHVGINEGFIQVFNPDGILTVTYNNLGVTAGLAIINNNVEEANGPTGGGTTNGLGYKPGTITVPAGQDGIWTVVFDYPSYVNTLFSNILNNAPWQRFTNQPYERRVVLAWDITISQNGAGNQGGNLLEGRVFSNEHISLINLNGFTTSPSFYVLTNDGYVYQVDFHDIDPFRFPISSNSLGLTDGNRKPIYKSKPESAFKRSDKPAEWQPDSLYLYEPQAKDDGVLVNNKLFFNPPNPDLPTTANVCDIFRNSTYSTWLLKPLEIIQVDSFYVVGEPGSGNPCSPGNVESGKPVYFIFETNLGGVATLELDLDANGNFTDPVDVKLSSAINAGIDELVWDGKDGLGNPIPAQNNFTFYYRGSIKFGELHIAFTDVENAQGGVTFKWLNAPAGYATDLFYYDHSDIGGGVSGGGTPGHAMPTNQPFSYSANAGNDRYVDHWCLVQLDFPIKRMRFDVVGDCLGNETDTELLSFNNGFDRPIDIAHCGDERLFVAEQKGLIWVLDENGNKMPTPFLDLQSMVGAQGEEQGLLGLAFHPAFADNGFFFVNYTMPDGNTRISRFVVSPSDPNLADPASEMVVMDIDQPFADNKGGGLKFGPDGYLYIATGDGGGEGDPFKNAQNLNSPLGKLLRLDVDNGSPYTIPPSNPFVGMADAKAEVWALGLRNPWRFSFDKATGDLWLGDMGEGSWEEIDHQPASSTGGENYGWRCYEADEDYSVAGCDAAQEMAFPVHQYHDFHTIGCGVVGGFVYRGCSQPTLFGQYIFTDRCSGKIWAMAPNGQVRELAHFPESRFGTLGENSEGELFLAGNGDGTVYKLTSQAVLLASVHETCAMAHDGQIQLNMASSPHVSYTWSDGNTEANRADLAPGAYSVTISTSNGCVFQESAVVEAGEGPSSLPMLAPTNESCPQQSDGQINFVVPTDQFAAIIWSDGSTEANRTGMVPGTYEVTATTLNGCTFIETASILAGQGPSSLPMLSATNASCEEINDGQINFIIPTNQFAAFAWSDGSSEGSRIGLATGIYSVTATLTNGCEFMETIEIGINEPLHPTIQLGLDSMLYTEVVAAQYQWLLNGAPIEGANEPSFMPIENGVYGLSVVTTAGCAYFSAPLGVNLFSPSLEAIGFASAALTPNPFERNLTLTVNSAAALDFTIRITDSAGKTYLTQESQSMGFTRHEFDLGQLPSGVFLVSFSTPKGVWSQRIIKR